MKAVLDRMEEGKFAVLLVEELNKEMVLPKEQLPDGSKANQWFDVAIEDGEVVSIEFDEQKTALQKEKAEEKMAKIRKNKQGSKFKRK